MCWEQSASSGVILQLITVIWMEKAAEQEKAAHMKNVLQYVYVNNEGDAVTSSLLIGGNSRFWAYTDGTLIAYP